MKTISIRELHQRTGAWVRKAAELGSITVTERGRPVARLEAVEEHGRQSPFRSRKLRPGYKRLMGRLTGGTDTVAIVSEDRLCQHSRRSPMNYKTCAFVFASAALLVSGLTGTAQAQQAGMTFFITSVGSGKGADLGGLAGADRLCQTLAGAVGAGGRTWRAYLSTQASAGAAAVNARDRIGRGPWQNAKGVVIAGNVDELHGNNNLSKQTALNEKDEVVNGRGDTPNRHDILTGTMPDGRSPEGDQDMTCGNWTKSGEGAAIVGHHDRIGLRDDAPSKSWNSSHPSRGCSQDALRGTGGDGLLYCFAAN